MKAVCRKTGIDRMRNEEVYASFGMAESAVE